MKKILIIGAGFLQSFVIKKASEMGYYTLAIDANPNAIGFKYANKYEVIDIINEKLCLEYAIKEDIDGVLTAATDYGVLTASYIAQEMRLPGIKYEVAQLIKNKYLTRKCLLDNHVDDTRQVYEVNKYTDIEALGRIIRYPVMVKPCDGSGSRGTSRVDKQDDFKSACKLAIHSSITNSAIVEDFVVGREYGVESLVVNGKIYVLAVMQKWMTKAPYYAELGHAIPNDLTEEVESRVKEYVYKALQALGVNFGSVNMDILITKKGKVHIIDIGARMGGNLIGSHIIKAGTGIDYMSAMIQNAAGDVVDLTSGEHKAVATKLLAFNEGDIDKLPDFQTLEKKYDVKIEHHMTAGDHIHEYHTNLDGCGYVVAVCDDVNQAIKSAEATRKEIASYIRYEVRDDK